MRKFAGSFFSDPTDWRSHEPSRLETFSDAVFAFALTLVIVSLEVPKTFGELYETMKGVVGFAICFLFLFLIWNTQNKFFRRYNLKGEYVTLLNACLLFVVLVYVYPLKFLFYLLFSSSTYLKGKQEIQIITEGDVAKLMVIYGLGYTIIFFLFYLMYRHVLARAEELRLTSRELTISKISAGENLINVVIGVISIFFAIVLPRGYAGDAGWIYAGIPVCTFIWKRRMKKFLLTAHNGNH